MVISRGKIQTALKVVVYGVEGIGKSTLASHFPQPIFIDTEGSTRHMDVARVPVPQSFAEIIEDVKYFQQHTDELRTLVIDTADWAEDLAVDEIVKSGARNNPPWTSIESPGYGKGYVMLAERFGKLLNECSTLVERGVNVVITAHAAIRKFEEPNESGAYDRWELKLEKKTAPLVKEWADLLLFCNYQTVVVDENGKKKGKGGARRVMYTTHTAAWDAKNRFGLPDMLDLDYSKIAQLVPDSAPSTAVPQQAAKNAAVPQQDPAVPEMSKVKQQLKALMEPCEISEKEIQMMCAKYGFFPAAMSVWDYPDEWIAKNLVARWDGFKSKILQEREEMPF